VIRIRRIDEIDSRDIIMIDEPDETVILEAHGHFVAKAIGGKRFAVKVCFVNIRGLWSDLCAGGCPAGVCCGMACEDRPRQVISRRWCFIE
jgi:hypothetical protein